MSAFWIHAMQRRRAAAEFEPRADGELRDVAHEIAQQHQAALMLARLPTAPLLAQPGAFIDASGAGYRAAHGVSVGTVENAYELRAQLATTVPPLQARTRMTPPQGGEGPRLFAGTASVDRALVLSGAMTWQYAALFTHAPFVSATERLGVRRLHFSVDAAGAVTLKSTWVGEDDLARAVRFAFAFLEAAADVALMTPRAERVATTVSVRTSSALTDMAALLDAIRDVSGWLSGHVDRVGDAVEGRFFLDDSTADAVVVRVTRTQDASRVHVEGQVPSEAVGSLAPERGLWSFFDKRGEIELGDPTVDDAWIIRGDAKVRDIVTAWSTWLPLLRTHEATVRWGSGVVTVDADAVVGGDAAVAEVVGVALEMWRALHAFATGRSVSPVRPTT